MTILELFENGTMHFLFKQGWMSIDRMAYHRYYLVWKAYREKGLSKNRSYELASDECGCSKRTVQTAVQLLA